MADGPCALEGQRQACAIVASDYKQLDPTGCSVQCTRSITDAKIMHRSAVFLLAYAAVRCTAYSTTFDTANDNWTVATYCSHCSGHGGDECTQFSTNAVKYGAVQSGGHLATFTPPPDYRCWQGMALTSPPQRSHPPPAAAAPAVADIWSGDLPFILEPLGWRPAGSRGLPPLR